MSDAATQKPDAPRSPRWMRLLLVASLALNLLVAGIVGGAMLGRHHHGDGPPRDLASSFYLRALPEAHRAAFVTAMRDGARDRRAGREAFRAEFASTLAVLRAENFDPEAFGARIAAQRGRLAERTALGDRLLVERLAAMSLDERRAYADRLEDAIARGPRRRD